MAKWFFEPGHTAAEFCVRHMMVTHVRGHFKDVHGRLEFDPTRRTVKLGERQARLTQQQTALVLFLAQGSKPATARDLIHAGLFRNNAAHSTVHSALLTLRRRLDDLEPGLGATFVHASARGYSLVAVHE